MNNKTLNTSYLSLTYTKEYLPQIPQEVKQVMEEVLVGFLSFLMPGTLFFIMSNHQLYVDRCGLKSKVITKLSTDKLR